MGQSGALNQTNPLYLQSGFISPFLEYFLYTQPAFVFHLLGDFCIVCDYVLVFCFCFCSERS